MENTWHLRKVADTAAKSCWICYKPSSSVLITPDNKDFFYVCPSHLKDSNFCQPTESEAAAIAERQNKEDLDREIEKIKAEHEAKMKKKQEKRKDKKDAKEKDVKKADQESDAQDEKEKDDKIKALTGNKDGPAVPASPASPAQASGGDNSPRIFMLKKYALLPCFLLSSSQLTVCRHFYQMRIEKMRNAEMAKRSRDRMRNPSLFPSVPSGNP